MATDVKDRIFLWKHNLRRLRHAGALVPQHHGSSYPTGRGRSHEPRLQQHERLFPVRHRSKSAAGIFAKPLIAWGRLRWSTTFVCDHAAAGLAPSAPISSDRFRIRSCRLRSPLVFLPSGVSSAVCGLTDLRNRCATGTRATISFCLRSEITSGRSIHPSQSWAP